MKWHDDNPERFKRLCVLCAVEQGFEVSENPRLHELIKMGFVREFTAYEITAKGEAEIKQANSEIHAELEARESEEARDGEVS